MKKYNQFTLFIVAITFLLSACENVDFGDTNIDPNNPSLAVTAPLLTNSIREMSAYISQTTPNLYVQYLSNGQYDEESRYETLNWDTDGYYGILLDLKTIIDLNTNPETSTSTQIYGSNANQIAAATILRVWFLHGMTDRWGYLPYREALDADNNIYPKYDSQEAIYNGLFDELDKALETIDSGAGPKGDILFDGNMSRWKTFANTIKLVMALRLSKANPTIGKEKFNEAVSGAISSNSQNIYYTYLTEDNNDNPWQDRFESRKDYLVSDVFVKALIGSGTNVAPEDPRLPKMADLAETSSTYVGAPYGVSNSNTNNYSFITKDIIKKGDAPLMIYTYSEVLFARAEAAALGWTSENASTLYNEAIMASMKQWGVNTADATTYITANPYSNVSDIAYEKWVSLYMQGYNSWAEWRRFKASDTEDRIGLIAPANLLSNATGIPQRHAYSSTAQFLNEANYNTAISEQGEDDLDTILWLFK
ncbi:SusD/RagB family nutrient-binding outer membrane lipoprotein [Pseudotenacibaculum haliotis]|uniref:SusD/RagB family nutrient-binding outer membrane lipoprotein n=1 Tax=Pseudotenacibaculum haliotis TaxID=1862138 RepID=A0ABW5LP42_9FLAO